MRRSAQGERKADMNIPTVVRWEAGWERLRGRKVS